MPQNKGARGCFLSKKSSYNHRSICFNNVPVIRANLREHLGLLFDSKLDFLDQINEEKKKSYWNATEKTSYYHFLLC